MPFKILILSICCSLISLGPVKGLTCLSCLGITHPRFCNHVDECSNGEVCGLEKVTYPSGEVAYNIGCFQDKTCHDNGTHDTCRHCCTTDLCNMAGCGEHGITHNRGPVCYHCTGVLTADECKTIDVCEQGEVCFLESELHFGEKHYRLSCQYKNICDAVTEGKPIVGKRDIHSRSTISTKCCSSDLCNIDFSSYKDYIIRDCTDLIGKYNTSGVFHIYPNGHPGYQVFCDMETDGGGWTVFQRRFNGVVRFHDKLWHDYKVGFGNVSGEHWLGNDQIHELTSLPQYMYDLRIELEDWENKTGYAMYKYFTVANESSKYQINFGEYSGTAGNSFKTNKHTNFTTIDNSNDGRMSNDSCAGNREYLGPWWYPHDCGYSNLNGEYTKISHGDLKVFWESFKGYYYSLKKTMMMLRRHT